MAAIDADIEAGSYKPKAPPHAVSTDRHGTRN
jgi:hypothetical protein